MDALTTITTAITAVTALAGLATAVINLTTARKPDPDPKHPNGSDAS